MVPPALAFLAGAVWLPQRMPGTDSNAILADGIAADLTATLAELKQQALITPAEEQRLDEEVERIRRAAQQRVDASSWEAADAFRERVAASLSEKQNAAKWAEESLARYRAAAAGGERPARPAPCAARRVERRTRRPSRNGLLAGAPADLQQLLNGGKLPADPESLSQLAEALCEYLAATSGKPQRARQAGQGVRPLRSGGVPTRRRRVGADGDGIPGTGGINRGRADAQLTWGKESLPLDRFKAKALPPGLPGAPTTGRRWSCCPARRAHHRRAAPPRRPGIRAAAGQNAWRRTLAPRHQSAVKKYFEK